MTTTSSPVQIPVPTSTGTFPAVADPLAHVGSLVRSARQHRGLTQAQLAERLGTSQTRDPPDRAGRAERQPRHADPDRRRARLRDRHASAARSAPHLRVQGGQTAHGPHRRATRARTARSRCCAPSLLNRGTHPLRNVARIVEVDRIVEVLRCHRRPGHVVDRRPRPRDLRPGATSTSTTIDVDAAAAPGRSSCSSARCSASRTSSACPTRAAATWAPAPSSRT